MGGKKDPNTTSSRHWNSSHLYTPTLPTLTLEKTKKKENMKKRPYLSPTTVFPAAAKCMSSNGGALWDWPLFTPDIHARQLFLTLPFYMPTTPPPSLHRQRSPLQFDTLLLKDLCCNKKQQLMFFLCCRRSSVLPGT